MKKILEFLGVGFLVFLLVSELTLAVFRLFYWQKNYPSVGFLDLKVSGLTSSQTRELLEQKLILPDKLYLEIANQLVDIETQKLELKYDPVATTNKIHAVGRDRSFLINLVMMFKPTQITPVYHLNETALTEELNRITETFKLSPQEASLSLKQQKVTAKNGTLGKSVDTQRLVADLKAMADSVSFQNLRVNLTPQDLRLSPNDLLAFQKRGQGLVGKTLRLYAEDAEVSLSDGEIISLLSPHGGLNSTRLTQAVQKIASEVNRPPQNPVFVFQDGRVTEFAPSRNGLEVDFVRLAEAIKTTENKLETEKLITFSTEIPVSLTFSEYKTEDVNNLGIKERIGRGESDFKGSIASRVHNVALAASKFNGVIVKPGETMSFNRILGDVSALTGYQQAYIIKDGATILGDGGGVCQVSSTMFRAALNAGLPILERQAHAYRVYYYEQNSAPGLDATVYDPSPDLKFKNDTGHHILIQTSTDTKTLHLTVEIYGTDDGRAATVTKPVIAEIIPPLPDVYVDDPTLPAGTVKQVDHQASGAKVYFHYSVERDGEIVYQKKFISNYQPWANRYLRGTGPAQ